MARYVEANPDAPVADVAAGFQEAVADVLTRKAVRAATDLGVSTLLIAGGVAANSRLRELAEERCAAAGLTLRVPRPRLCTDNGAMIASFAAHLIAAGARAVAAGRGQRPRPAGGAGPGRVTPPTSERWRDVVFGDFGVVEGAFGVDAVGAGFGAGLFAFGHHQGAPGGGGGVCGGGGGSGAVVVFRPGKSRAAAGLVV